MPSLAWLQRQLAHFPLLLSKNVAISGDPPLKMSQLPEWGFTHLCMHLAGGGELASEGAAEGVRGVDDGAAPAAQRVELAWSFL